MEGLLKPSMSSHDDHLCRCDYDVGNHTAGSTAAARLAHPDTLRSHICDGERLGDENMQLSMALKG